MVDWSQCRGKGEEGMNLELWTKCECCLTPPDNPAVHMKQPHQATGNQGAESFFQG